MSLNLVTRISGHVGTGNTTFQSILELICIIALYNISKLNPIIRMFRSWLYVSTNCGLSFDT